jgi:hypothetical protein
MAGIEDEIAAFKTLQSKLEAESMGQWVLIHDGQVVNVYETFEGALQEAGQLFDRGPYLIRQIGAPPIVLPASVMYRRAPSR